MSKIDWTNPADPCPCGSKKIFGSCHENEWKEFAKLITIPESTGAMPKEAWIALNCKVHKSEIRKQRLMEIGYYLPHLHQVSHSEDSSTRVVFNRIYHYNNNISFTEFIFDLFVDTVGLDWINQYITLPEDQQPFLVLSVKKKFEWIEKRKQKSVPWDGYTRWLMALAFDIYCLKHVNKLPDDLILRLKHDGDQFQGARYEIGIAAMFVRLGYAIEFLDRVNTEYQKPCEFVIKSPSGDILVEAKSAHKDGVLHTKGEFDELKAKKVRVGGLINKALTKTTGNKPLLIFIDVNSPPSDEYEKEWGKNVQAAVNEHAVSTKESPIKSNYIFFTNFPFHYQKEKESSWPEAQIYKMDFPQNILQKEEELIKRVTKGLTYYGFPPDLK